MKSSTFKIAFIGTHGVGKTTLCYGLAARLKAADFPLEVVGEVARRCPLPINHETTLDAQSWILHTQIAEEIVAANRGRVVICDRSVLDNFVYLLIASGSMRPPELETLIAAWTSSYDLLVRVPILENPSPDGLRATDPAFQKAVHERLEREIAQRQLEVVDLTGLEREQWLDHVERAALKKLQPAQMRLIDPSPLHSSP
ncbi:MAG: ATP-binding protein [Acidobacteriota bacterium]